VWFWFAFPLWPEMVSIFSCVFLQFEFLLLRKFCLVQLPTSLLVHWFWESLVFKLPVYSCYQTFFWCVAGKHFLPLCGGLFSLETISFVEQKLFNFMKSHLSILSLSCWTAGVLLRKSLPIPIASRVFPALFYSSFRVLGLILRSLIHFELRLVQGDKHGSSFRFLQTDNHFSQQHLLKRQSFLHHVFLVTLSKIRWA
jgi:hypothetical protein